MLIWRKSSAQPRLEGVPLRSSSASGTRALGVPAYFLLGDPRDELIAAADRVSAPYAVQSSGWLYCSGGQTPGGNQGPISLVNSQQTITGQGNDRALAASFADLNVLDYRAADDEPDPPRTDVCVAPQTLDWFRNWLAPLYGHSDALLQQEWGPGVTLATATPSPYAATVAQFSTSSRQLVVFHMDRTHVAGPVHRDGGLRHRAARHRVAADLSVP